MHAVVPGDGEVGDGEIAGDEGLFEAEAEDDVGGVGHFVGVDADEAAADAAEEGCEVGFAVGGVRTEGGGEFAGHGGKVGVGAAGLHFDDEGLAFVGGHAAGLADGLAGVGGGEAAFVEGVAGFVHHAHEALREVSLVVAGGDADIGGGAAAEGMGGAVEAGVFGFEPGLGAHAAAEGFLAVGGERSGGADRGRAGGLEGFGARQGVAQEGFVGGEDGSDVGGADAALVAVHQGVVGGEAEDGGEGGGLFADEADDIGERGADLGEVRPGAGVAPDFLTGGVGAGLGFDEVGRDGVGAGVGVAHEGEVGGLPGVEGGGVAFGGGEVVFHLGRDELAVGEAGEDGELVAAGGAAAAGHHGRRVPAEHGGGLVDGGHAGEAGGEAVIGIVHGRSTLRAKMEKTPARLRARPYQVSA